MMLMMAPVGLTVCSMSMSKNMPSQSLFLHPSIPSASFFYAKRKDVLDMGPSEILTRVQP